MDTGRRAVETERDEEWAGTGAGGGSGLGLPLALRRSDALGRRRRLLPLPPRLPLHSLLPAPLDRSPTGPRTSVASPLFSTGIAMTCRDIHLLLDRSSSDGAGPLPRRVDAADVFSDDAGPSADFSSRSAA